MYVKNISISCGLVVSTTHTELMHSYTGNMSLNLYCAVDWKIYHALVIYITFKFNKITNYKRLLHKKLMNEFISIYIWMIPPSLERWTESVLQISCLFPHKICNTHAHAHAHAHTHTHTQGESRWFICSFQILQNGRRANWVMHAHTERKKSTISLLRHTHTHTISAFPTAVIKYLLSVMPYEVLNAPKINFPPAEPLDCRESWGQNDICWYEGNVSCHGIGRHCALTDHSKSSVSS